jgi:hypothetical protein
MEWFEHYIDVVACTIVTLVTDMVSPFLLKIILQNGKMGYVGVTITDGIFFKWLD